MGGPASPAWDPLAACPEGVRRGGMAGLGSEEEAPKGERRKRIEFEMWRALADEIRAYIYNIQQISVNGKHFLRHFGWML